MTDFILDVLIQGLAYGFLALGVYVTYKVLDYADLSVEGSFPMGAAIAAVCIINGWNPFLTLILSFAGGMLAGCVTGILHVKFKISSLLSGILVMTGMYSINLIITSEKSNLPIFNYDTIFTLGTKLAKQVDGELGIWLGKLYPVLLLLILVLLAKFLLDWFLNTKLGFLLRITGDNPQLVASLGQNIGTIKIIGLAISNGYAAMSGAVICQVLKYFDMQLKDGIIVLGLASVILGMSVFGKSKHLKSTSVVILGAILYRLTIAVALRFGLPAYYLKLIMAIIFILALISNNGALRHWYPKGGKE